MYFVSGTCSTTKRSQSGVVLCLFDCNSPRLNNENCTSYFSWIGAVTEVSNLWNINFSKKPILFYIVYVHKYCTYSVNDSDLAYMTSKENNMNKCQSHCSSGIQKFVSIPARFFRPPTDMVKNTFSLKIFHQVLNINIFLSKLNFQLIIVCYSNLWQHQKMENQTQDV